MHIDPAATDAYNTCVVGHKAWAYLPKDLYEFEEDWSCDQACSPGLNELNSAAFWIDNILPQMRFSPSNAINLLQSYNGCLFLINRGRLGAPHE